MASIPSIGNANPLALPLPSTWRQRMVSHVRSYIPLFKEGFGLSLQATGVIKILVGLKFSYAYSSLMPGLYSFGSGTAFILGGHKFYPFPLPTCASSVIGSIASIASQFFIFTEIFPKIHIRSPEFGMLVGFTIETTSSLVMGGMTTVAADFIAKKMVDAYRDFRESNAYRADSEERRPLNSPEIELAG